MSHYQQIGIPFRHLFPASCMVGWGIPGAKNKVNRYAHIQKPLISGVTQGGLHFKGCAARGSAARRWGVILVRVVLLDLGNSAPTLDCVRPGKSCPCNLDSPANFYRKFPTPLSSIVHTWNKPKTTHAYAQKRLFLHHQSVVARHLLATLCRHTPGM
jgi:hypothetical protein